MFSNTARPLAALTLLTAFSPSCAQEADVMCEADEKCDVINPTGGDSTGIIAVGVTDLDELPREPDFRQTLTVDALAIDLGEERILSTAKEHCVGIKTNARASGTLCDIEIAEDTLNVVELPSLEIDAADTPTFGLDRARHLKSHPTSIRFAIGPEPVFFRWGQGDGIKIEPQLGQALTIDLDDLSQRRTTLVTKEGTAEFADGNCQDVMVRTKSGGGADPGHRFDLDLQDPDFEMRVGLHESVDKELQLQVNGFRVPLTLSDVGEPSTSTKIFRIDVNDVLFNGTDLIEGTYTVLRRDADDEEWESPSKCHVVRPTKTGVWVPEGRYQVTVRFQTIDGLQTQQHEISFP